MKCVNFLEEPRTYTNEEEFVGYLFDVEGENELFKKLSEVLQFPQYFGNNWNAVYDCLCDLHWITKKGIVPVHNQMPLVSDEILQIYLEVLFDAAKSWNNDDEHYLKIVFAERSRQHVEAKLIDL
ncbi:barstar family protein [Mucilaginibacter sp.]|uniref:barstar family protein n=1 Tax=Mucilaginibacter sp. TaxID=1882438 RepID=UPI002ED50706